MIKTLPTISASFASNIFWLNNKSEYTLGHEDVHVWKIKVPEHFSDLFKEYRSILSKDEYYKATRFFWEADFRRYITCRIALSLLLGEYLTRPVSEIKFDIESKKPRLNLPEELKYNISYSGDLILISIGFCETGIDIEEINTYFNYKAILYSCFNEEEVNSIEKKDGNSYQKFFLQWTRKEALLKYTGQGLIDDLTIIPSLNGEHTVLHNKLELNEDIQLTSFHIDDYCIGSIVYPSYVSNISYINWK